MINQPIIADAGIVAAYLNKKDQWHEWTLSQLRNLPTPFLTCEAVITEACFLMQSAPGGKDDVLRMLADEVLQIKFSLANEVTQIKALMKKYKDVPMSLADACLVRMSEQIENSIVFTTDSDFHIYRKKGKQKIDLIIP